MRLIGSFTEEKQAGDFSAFLTREKLKNRVEAVPNQDWGSESYGVTRFNVWVYDEDAIDQAREYYAEFLKTPNDPKFQVERAALQELLGPVQGTWKKSEPELATPQQHKLWLKKSHNGVTVYLIVLCAMLFLVSELGANWVKTIPSYIPWVAVTSSPMKKTLLYDYPHALEIADDLLVLYGSETLMAPDNLPEEGKSLVDKYLKTPYWKGFYYELVVHFTGTSQSWTFHGPLFEKIREGQWWRVLSPCFLHGDLLHLLFNMIWLAVLGVQIESRIGKARYILFMVVAALVSNTAQYLMSGFNFLGFSGVVCAMFTYVWMRQKMAPWEGYLLHPSTVAFILVFVLGMIALQGVSFFMEIYYDTTLPIGIANTAHLSGGLIGVVGGRFNLLGKHR